MINKETLKFKKNESFYIRDGWMEKAINTIKNNEGTNIFAKNDGINYLGIGSNMVKGLKYWLQASRIIESSANKTILSNFVGSLHVTGPSLLCWGTNFVLKISVFWVCSKIKF